MGSKFIHDLPTSIKIGIEPFRFKQSLKNLGFTLDCHLTMNAHIYNIFLTCYWTLIHLDLLDLVHVKARSIYIIACLCFHCHSSTAPSYVADMLQKMQSYTRNTRSSSYTMPLLTRPAHSRAKLGDRSFSFASSPVWNSFLNDVRCAHHCHHLCLVWRDTSFVQLTKTELSLWSLYICALFGFVSDLLIAFLENALRIIKNIYINYLRK